MSPHTAQPNRTSKPKKNQNGDGRPWKKRKLQQKPIKEGSSEEVLLHDIRSSLNDLQLQKQPSDSPTAEVAELPERFTEVDVKITALSSTGDGLGFSSSGQLYVIPFCAPGDTVRAKVISHFLQEKYSLADFLSVIEPSSLRDDSRIKCPYFASCGGCQFQMLDYSTQLAHKKTIIEKAYRNFSGLAPEFVPAIEDINGSPLQYGYRTKLTPHFDGPRGGRRQKVNIPERGKRWDEVPPIGFMKKGIRATLDIEDCPIGTDAVRKGLVSERQRISENIETYKRGATLLLRENTDRNQRSTGSSEEETGSSPDASVSRDAVVTAHATYVDYKTCITDSNATSTEYVDSHKFSNPAGSFFQNNNSILPSFTSYIRSRIVPSSTSTSLPITNLIDAYCGSGLFSVTLASFFESTTGIDISPSSIEYARRNAVSNNVSNTKFIAADAVALFKEITYPPDETVVVIDPPRKGCDASFLRQLVEFGPKRVVYVSCNVHTQARDIGVLAGERNLDGADKNDLPRYEIESLGGFDFFPQTSHVEGVAFLSRVDEGQKNESSDT